MSDTEKYYTPKAGRTPGSVFKTPSSRLVSTQKRSRYTPYKTPMDSEASSSDATSDDNGPVSSSNDELTIVAAFDDLMRLVGQVQVDRDSDRQRNSTNLTNIQ